MILFDLAWILIVCFLTWYGRSLIFCFDLAWTLIDLYSIWHGRYRLYEKIREVCPYDISCMRRYHFIRYFSSQYTEHLTIHPELRGSGGITVITRTSNIGMWGKHNFCKLQHIYKKQRIGVFVNYNTIAKTKLANVL